MVQVYGQLLTEQYNIVMEEQSSSKEEKRSEQEVQLPSMGLGDLVTNEKDARRFMERIRQSDGLTLIAPSEVPEDARIQSKPWSGLQGPLKGVGPLTRAVQPSRKEPQPGTSSRRNPYQKPPNGNVFTLTAGKTTPLGTSTINMEHLHPSEDVYNLDTKSGLFESVTKMAELDVKTAEYTRFRYASERPDKGKKTRQYEMDEEKRFMADVKISHHTGAGTVIIHCVNSQGHLHPYHLDGEDCTDGVFYKRFEFSPRTPILKILKTTVIQPKAKEYKKSLADQKRFLTDNKALDGKEKICENPTDKQCVHFHVKVFLDDGRDYIYRNKITNAIRNKKDGTEFRIHAIIPPSATARGTMLKHMGQSVHIIVTNETAFPKDVAVVFRNKVLSWEMEVKGENIKVIKKAVIEILPPSYPDPNITENVEVDVCLRDCATKKETEPVKFLYIGDEYGTNAKKAKKRKHEELDEQSAIFQSTFGDPDIQETKRILHAIRNVNLQNPDNLEGSEATSNSSENTPHYSLEFAQDDSMNIEEYQIVTSQKTGDDISLDEKRVNRGIEASVAATAENPLPESAEQSLIGQSIPISQNMMGESDVSFLQSLQLNTQSNSTWQELLDQLSPDMLMRLANLIKDKKANVIPEFENLVWERIAKVFMPDPSTNQQLPQQTAQVQPSEQDQPVSVGPVQSLTDLPELPQGYNYAIIQGQIVVVQNDIQETTQSQSVSVAGQQVIITQMDPVQPTENAPSDLLSSKTFNDWFGGNLLSTGGVAIPGSSVAIPGSGVAIPGSGVAIPGSSVGMPGSGVSIPRTSSSQLSSSSQPNQPPAAFWRARTGASSNLEDDDDIEIDFGVNPAPSLDISVATGEMNGDDKVMDVDETNDKPIKTHSMRLRGKKINYKNALRDFEDALSDIKDSTDEAEEQEDGSDNDSSKYSKYTKRTSLKGKERKGQSTGKALYEGGSEDDETYDNANGSNKNTSIMNCKGKKYGKGKDLRLVEKLNTVDDDENSQGFECSSQS